MGQLVLACARTGTSLFTRETCFPILCRHQWQMTPLGLVCPKQIFATWIILFPREATMHFARIYTDSEGISHLEDLEVELAEVNFAPPAPPVQLSAYTSATQWAFFATPPGWKGDWHTTPTRQIFFYLVGQVEVELGDGTIRRFGPGDATIVEDTTGKGHRSRTVGDVTALQAVVQMPDDE